MKAHKIMLYKFYTKQLEKPLVMEAESRKQAIEMLQAFNDKIGKTMKQSDIVDMRVETLVVGESSKIKNKVKHIWVGKDQTQSGWLEHSEYMIIVNRNKNNRNGN